jgi:signal transduction histidine kinase
MSLTVFPTLSARLLVIDDNRAIHDDFRKILTAPPAVPQLDALEVELFGERPPAARADFIIDSAYQGQEGLERVECALAEGRPYQMAFVDVRMPPGWDGVETVEHLWRVDPALQVVICTAYSDYQWADIAARLPHGDQFLILKKPFDPIEVNQMVQALCSKWYVQQKFQTQLDTLDHLIQQRTAELREANEQLRAEITQREKMELELRLAQKLEAVGQLAAGIAHEINTPIQYVGDSVHFLKTAFEDLQTLLDRYQEGIAALEQQPDQAKLVAVIRDAEDLADLDYLRDNIPSAVTRTLEGIGHVAGIVRAMKEFAHPDQREKSPADLNQALRTTLTVARNEYKYVADIETHLGELPQVLCYPSDLNQVFLNLIVNAAHAIAEVVSAGAPRGKITLTTRVDDAWVEITIADTGGGIPATIRDRVYDPFFTTKPVGKGTGQGLAIARSIVVDKHQGALSFTSEPGQGTTFSIRLPVG